MNKTNMPVSYGARHTLRSTVLNFLLTIMVVASAPAIIILIVNQTRTNTIHPLTIVLAAAWVLLVILSVFHRINYHVRVWSLLVVGYAATAVNLTLTGIRGFGPLFLMLLSVIALALIGKWASLVVSAVSALLLLAFAVLFNLGIIVPDAPLLGTGSSSTWMAFATVLMILAIIETLLLIFYHSKVSVIDKAWFPHKDLLLAKTQLVEHALTLKQQVKERTSELLQSYKIQTALYEIAETTNSSQNINEFYARIHKIIGGLMYANNFFVATYDEATDLLSYPYYVDESGDTFPTQLMGNSRNLTSYIIRTGKAIKHGQEEFHAIEASGEYKVAGNPNEDGVGAPLVADGKNIGAIYIQSYDKNIHYTEKDDEVLAFVAQHIATALTRFRAAESERQRANEQATLYTVADAIGKTLDLKTIARVAGENLQQIFGADAVAVMLLDVEQNLITNYYAFDKNDGGYLEKIEPFPLGTGLSSKVITTGKPLLLGTLEEEIANGAYFPSSWMAQSSGTLSQSWLGVPILAKDQPIGVVFLASYVPHAFNESNKTFLQTLSSTISTAIENARLFDETQRLLRETERRATELAAVNAVGSALVKELDLDDLIQLVGEQIVAVFKADIAYLAFVDEITGDINFPYTYGELMAPITTRDGLTSKVVNSGRPLLINGDLDQNAVELGITRVGESSCSYLGVPIIVSGKPVGVISVQSTTCEELFTEDDVRLLSTIATNVGTAMHNARLFTEAKLARAESEKANKAKSAFLANMSHELRTPLNAIIGFTRIVRRKAEGVLPEKQTENLDKVLLSAEHLLGLINTTLDIAKIEAGRMDVLAANFRIAPLIDLCINTSTPLLKPKVVLDKKMDDSLSQIYSDQEKIRQIMLNLLSNAAKFTHEGRILLSVNREGEDLLRIDVEDTGIGISPEAIPRIFKEFQQADNSTTRQYGGSGLGLSISRNLARLLGGDITFVSELGKGSTFTVTLPINYKNPSKVSSDAGMTIAKPPASGWESSQSHTEGSGKKRILVIDDDPDAIYLLQENLDEHEFNITGSRDGWEGLELAREQKPHAILLDILLPGTDGWQILHDLKEDPVTANIPVILLTIVDKKALGLRLGASAYLLKPLDPVTVKETLARVIGLDAHQQKHVLVVDDDPNIADMIRQFLPEEDFAVDSAWDGEAGIEAVDKTHPDIVLLDILMPRLDGFGVIERLRLRSETRDLPIIVISAKDLSKDECRKLNELVICVMKKQGLEGQILVDEINAALNKYDTVAT